MRIFAAETPKLSAAGARRPRRLIDFAIALPDDCTWDDVMYRFYVRQKIEAGRRDIEQGRTIPHEQVMAEFFDASD